MPSILDSLQCITLKVPPEYDLKSGSAFLTKNRDSLLVVDFFHGLFLFDTKGDFIRKIETPPSDYKTGMEATAYNHTLQFDATEGIYYKDARHKWIGVSIHTGRVVKWIMKPSQYIEVISNFKSIGSRHSIGFVNNWTGEEKNLFVIFDNQGKIVHTFPNRKTYLKYTRDTPLENGLFYDYDSKSYCKEPSYGTTVYEINDGNLYPHIEFYLGENTPIYYNRDMPNSNLGRYMLGSVAETKRRIYFSYNVDKDSFFGYYDKESGETYVNEESGKEIIESGNITLNHYFPFFRESKRSVTEIDDGDKKKVFIGILK